MFPVSCRNFDDNSIGAITAADFIDLTQLEYL